MGDTSFFYFLSKANRRTKSLDNTEIILSEEKKMSDLTMNTPATTNTTSLSKRPRNRDWLVRHIPVMVKGRSPRQYRVPKLISSVVMAVCLYLAVHLNRPRSNILRRGERDISYDAAYAQYYYQPYPIQYNLTNYQVPQYQASQQGAVFEMEVPSGYVAPDAQK